MTHSSPPRTPVEETIAAIWADVLGHTDIGVFDDFFELGGHSLLAPRVVARIRKTLGVQIPVMDFFDGPTVAQLAVVVNARSSAQPQVIGRRAPDAAPVLSFDQQRLWLENQLLPGAAYNVHGRRRLVGAVDVGALQASVRAILARHESLRTRFPTVDGQPQQIVDDADPQWRLDVRDLRDHDGDREAAALSLADEQATTPFDLAEGPLFRCQLIRLTGTVHVLSVTMHHIVSDAWSIGLFVRELSALYQAGGDAERAGLAPLPIQFRDYAVWQRRWLSGDRLEKQLDHWRTHLAGAPPTLALPTGRRLLTTQGGAADTIPFELTVDETTALRGLCRKHGVTPFMTLLAGLSTVLSRWSGQSDVVIGVPLASRGNPGTDAMIGFLVNTLPMRVRLADAATFADLLTQVRQTALDGYAHADAPLDTLVREAQATRDPRRTPLFQAVLNVMGAPEVEQVTGIEIQAMDDTPAVPSKFDLALIAKEVHGALQLQLYFNGGRFPASVMRLLAGQLAVFLRGVLDDPARGLLDYPLEPVRQPQPAVTPPAVSLDLARHGGRIAVIDDAGGWSYRWLDEAAGRVAAELGARGVGSGDHLAVVRRPVAAFAAVLLGCRRVGATFAVVEPESVVPAAYLGAKLLLDVGSGAADAVDLSEVLPAGSPTAVGGDGDRYAVLSGAPGHRTAALVEALTAGAALVLSEVPLNGDVAGWLREHGITAAYLSPPVLRAAASAAEPGVPGLRDVFVENTGELLAHDVTAAVRLAPQGRFVSLYRIGADGVPLARYEVPAGWRPDEAPLRVPLGVELPGVPASLRHAGGQPAAVNEVAGLHFGTHDTGDLARRSPDGTLAFVRRVDASPLIDLAETVGALRDLPGVHDAVVVEELGPDGETVLAGYLTGPEPGGPTVGLRQQLLLRLPGFLIPARLVVLGRLPLTADGAYDLDALGDQDATTGHGDYVAPRTPMERQLIEILQELLGLERIGIHDSFFELGGFSLLATQLTTRIREQFGVEPSLRDVFESPTVDELAQLIVRTQFTLTGADGLEALLDEIVSAEPGRG
ncbi:condensation domain-containing protein [Actinoplanes sp. NPDC026670]|uniref:condensation domain-containing protein n=1 Tax=Actinoplanes sp. NPDC026670 TaxID=3154700 RepID=UPI0033FC2CDE